MAKETKKEDKVKDENLMAALAHAGIVLGGTWVALIIWLLQKDKSDYVDFQAKQALLYQIGIYVLGVILGISLGIFHIIFGLLTIGIGFLFGLLLWPLAGLLGLTAIIYGLYGAYETLNGKEFKYYWLGDKL